MRKHFTQNTGSHEDAPEGAGYLVRGGGFEKDRIGEGSGQRGRLKVTRGLNRLGYDIDWMDSGSDDNSGRDMSGG
jgi:hypothetical protein